MENSFDDYLKGYLAAKEVVENNPGVVFTFLLELNSRFTPNALLSNPVTKRGYLDFLSDFKNNGYKMPSLEFMHDKLKEVDYGTL